MSQPVSPHPRLSIEEARKVASLARLQLSDAQLARLTPQLARVLDYFSQLDEVDTAGIEPMAHAIEMTDVFREDVPREGLSRESALANAPKSDGRYFLVPPILEGS